VSLSRTRRGWRWLKYRALGQGVRNAASRRSFASHRPALDEVQARLVADLARDGFALTSFAELFGAARWEPLRAAGQAFAEGERVRRAVESYRTGSTGKQYLVRLWPEPPELSPDDPWLRLGLDPRLLDLVNGYLGLWSKLNYVDLWYTIPVAGERRAVASQRWHRDPEDERMVKAFLYLADVDEGAGPLEYVRGSTGAGRWSGLWPNPALGEASYPPDGELEARVPASDRVLCTGPAGTLVLCDTHGFHRGGLATRSPRLFATWAWVTPASIFARRFRTAGIPEASSIAAEYALR
jgi:hypothetical protein